MHLGSQAQHHIRRPPVPCLSAEAYQYEPENEGLITHLELIDLVQLLLQEIRKVLLILRRPAVIRRSVLCMLLQPPSPTPNPPQNITHLQPPLQERVVQVEWPPFAVHIILRAG